AFAGYQSSASSASWLVGSALPGAKRTTPSNIWLATPLSAVEVARCGSSVALSAAPELMRSIGRSASCALAKDEKPAPTANTVDVMATSVFSFMVAPRGVGSNAAILERGQ